MTSFEKQISNEDKSTFLFTGEGKNYYLDQSLNQIEREVDSSAFVRTSRKELVNIDFITDIIHFGHARCTIKIISAKETKDIVISRERMKSFRNWLSQAQ